MVYSRHPADTDFQCLPDWGLPVTKRLHQSLQLINVFRHLSGRQQQWKLLCNFHWVPQIARCHGYFFLVTVITIIIITIIIINIYWIHLNALNSTKNSTVSYSTACQRGANREKSTPESHYHSSALNKIIFTHFQT